MRTICSLSVALSLIVALSAQAQDTLKEGSKVPGDRIAATSVETALPNAKDKDTLSLQDFEGKKNIVLFFYPKALTGGCTVESCGFRDKLAEFKKLDTVVIGISTDPVSQQLKFTEKESLTFPLIADTEGKLTRAFGAMGAKVANRYTYVIDKTGIVRKAYTKVAVKDHPTEVLEYVRENLK